MRALAGAHRLGAACETAAWPYGDRHIGPKPFIRQRCLLGPADYAHARRGETFDSASDTAIVVSHPPRRRQRLVTAASAGPPFKSAFGCDSAHPRRPGGQERSQIRALLEEWR